MAAHVTLISSDDNAEFTVHEHLACAERHPAAAVVEGYTCRHDDGNCFTCGEPLRELGYHGRVSDALGRPRYTPSRWPIREGN